jgi:hypothetical protein
MQRVPFGAQIVAVIRQGKVETTQPTNRRCGLALAISDKTVEAPIRPRGARF